MAADARALAAGSDPELRERVDRAAALLDEAGNVYNLAELLSAAAYQALRLGSDRDARNSSSARSRSRANSTIPSAGWSSTGTSGSPHS